MDYDSFYHPGIKESQKIMPLLLHGRAVCAQIPQIAQENEAVRRQNEKYEACDKSLKELRQIKTQMLRAIPAMPSTRFANISRNWQKRRRHWIGTRSKNRGSEDIRGSSPI